MISLNTSFGLAMKAGLTLAVAAGFYLQPYRPMVFVGHSMEPTYTNRTVTWTGPVAHQDLKRGQVVVINMDGGPIVKRIAFLPGDKFLRVKMDGAWVDMIYVHPIKKSHIAAKSWQQFVVPPGMVYVLGDNQRVSLDSRQFGCVSMSLIDRALVDQRHYNPFASWHTETFEEE